MEYTTAIIEAVGVEHKETTRYVSVDDINMIHILFLTYFFVICYEFECRNYDILAAVFTDVLKNMHDDFDFV